MSEVRKIKTPVPRMIDPATPGHFHVNTQLPDGRPSILVDPGSKGNLVGEDTSKYHATCAIKAGRTPQQHYREKALNVMGVGNGAQSCHFDTTIPIALRRQDGSVANGNFTAPMVPSSNLPALLGLDALKEQKAVLDIGNRMLHFVGPGDVEIVLPPGSESYQLEVAPSGHLVLPIGNYTLDKDTLWNKKMDEAELALLNTPHDSHVQRGVLPPGVTAQQKAHEANTTICVAERRVHEEGYAWKHRSEVTGNPVHAALAGGDAGRVYISPIDQSRQIYQGCKMHPTHEMHRCQWSLWTYEDTGAKVHPLSIGADFTVHA
jgi:hypothetical protein